MLKDKHVMLYVTGSVAAYKAVLLMRLLQKTGAKVRVTMTRAATEFIQPLTFEALSHEEVLVDSTPGAKQHEITHIQAAQWTDLAIVIPASANVIAKMAHGIADDMATTTLLATDATKFVVPAMNDHMWNNSATVRNVEQLKQDGVHFLMPTNGMLAEGYAGQGRMVEPETVFNMVDDFLSLSDHSLPLKGKKVLVTAAGTQEAIDPVRFIANRSSGKMGYAIANVARQMGATVTLISGPSQLKVPQGVTLISVVSTHDLETAVLNQFLNHDILIMAAAVADFTVVDQHQNKIKKVPGENELTIKFKLAPDILKEVASIKRSNQYTVGFAAETTDLINNAQKKLIQKNLNMLVANDVSKQTIGFNSDQNQVTFLKPDQTPIQTTVENKSTIAQQLLQQIIFDIKKEEA